MARLAVDHAALRRAAKWSRWHAYTLQTADQLHDELPRGSAARIETRPPIPLWNHWIVVALFLVGLVSEWIVRKRIRPL